MTFYIDFKEVTTLEPKSISKDNHGHEKMIAVCNKNISNKIIALFRNEDQAKSWVGSVFSGRDKSYLKRVPVYVDVKLNA
jgi:hypothetical protein